MFFFREGDRKVTENFQFIETYNNPEIRKLKPDERAIQKNIDLVLDFYDLSCFTSQFLDYLIEKGFSVEWTENTEIEEVFRRYFVLKDSDLAEAARQWFSHELSDIETKVNAKDVETGDKENPTRYRTSEEKRILRALLFDEKFLSDKEYFDKYKKKKEVKNE